MQPDAPDRPVDWQYVQPITDDLRRRVVAAFFRYRFPRLPGTYMGFGVPVVVLLVGGALGNVVVVLIGIAALAYRCWLLVAGYRAGLARLYPGAGPGAAIRTAYGPDAIVIDLPGERVHQAYANYSRIVVRGDVVLMRLGAAAHWTVLPASVLPPHELRRFPAAR